VQANGVGFRRDRELRLDLLATRIQGDASPRAMAFATPRPCGCAIKTEAQQLDVLGQAAG
jgi:hypothetical protein